MVQANENTPLLRENIDPTLKPYKRKNNAFHICLYASLGVLIFVAFIAAVWYIFELRSSKEDPQNVQDLNALLENKWPRPDAQAQNLPYESFITLINEAVDEGKQQLKVRQLKDENVPPLDPTSPTLKHQQSIVYSPVGSNLSNYGYIETIATKYLRDKGVRNVVCYDSATDLKWANETDCNHFNQSISCEPTSYGSISGSCNNLKHPQKWGVAMTPFRRVLAPEYEDGVSVPRGGFETSLPSARDISDKINRPVYQKDENFTVMLAVWGQFLDHDLTATALSRGVNGTPITCCNSKIQHPECFPVVLSSNDSYYGELGLTCMEFVRSAPALRCSFGPREQLNQASSYIDGSMIYGNTESLADQLRTFNNGELKMSYSENGRALLPVTKDPIDGCDQLEETKKGRYCFLSGDARANENTHLTSIHLIFARHHNNIANKLREFNPYWDDEKLYQESRRIVIAQLQHVTYNEFLPGILGDRMMATLDLNSYKTHYWTKYNDSIDVTISNNFAAAAFRFAHTLIPRMMKLLANDTESPEYVEMHKMLFNPFGLYDGELDSIIRGALNTSIEKADNYFTEQLTKHLFEPTNTKKSPKSFGLDLVSLNIQRGRDHGLATYPEWRKYCNLSSVHSFDDLHGIFDEESLAAVSSLYKSVDDIDLYTGGLSEIPIAGGLLGPTLTCLIADQFYRLKYGDRYWYETDEKPQAFTPEQLNEIRKTSLAGIICQNADDLQLVTPAVMRSSKDNNEHIPCSNVPQPDISVWQINPQSGSNLTVIHIRIELPNRVFTWSNESQSPLSPQLLNGGHLTSISVNKRTTHRDQIVELSGKFVYVSENGHELSGLFELKAVTSVLLDLNYGRVKYPVYLTENGTEEHISNSSKIVLHTVPVSSNKIVWTGTVTVNLIPLFWNNATDSSKSNKTEENDSRKSSQSIRPQGEILLDMMSRADERDTFSAPSKRAQNSNLERNTQVETDLKFYNKNITDSEEDIGSNDINTRVLELYDRNLTSKSNILYHILETETPPTTSSAEDELTYLHQLNAESSIYLDNSPQSTPAVERITSVNISVESAEISDHPVLKPPVEIPADRIKNETIVWDFDSMDPLSGTFEIPFENGTFKIKYDNEMSNNLFRLNPACKYYSKIILAPPANESDLFDVDVSTAPDGCSVIAPLHLHGTEISPETFSWDGNVTFYIRNLSNDLSKEDELSIHMEPEKVFTLQKMNGLISLRNQQLWNGTLPTSFRVADFGWHSSNHTIAYPITWSGIYEDLQFVGNYDVLLKIKSSVDRQEGKFSISVPSSSNLRDFVKPFELYESIFYLTEKLSYIYEFDVSQFEIIDEWDSTQASKIVLIGNLSQDEFVWSGDVIFITPKHSGKTLLKTSDSNVESSYRPHGKFFVTILDATVFAVLGNRNSIIKWWSGIVPESVIIPASLPQIETFKRIFNRAIIWSYEENNTSGHATFKTYGDESQIHLFGDFQFNISTLFENINTSVLKPKVDYYSPLVLQNEMKNYNVDADLIIELNDWRDPKAGVFAPIMLLGNYTENGQFKWNLQCIVHVEDNYS